MRLSAVAKWVRIPPTPASELPYFGSSLFCSAKVAMLQRAFAKKAAPLLASLAEVFSKQDYIVRKASVFWMLTFLFSKSRDDPTRFFQKNAAKLLNSLL